ncbi:hypothetical protein KKC97_03305 [bacterium]|nr:hypothetical protein [bacterium]
MVKIISIFLIQLMLIVPVASLAQENVEAVDITADTEQYDEAARLEGRAFAQQHYQGWRWFGAGLVGGTALGLLGAGIAVGFSQTGTAHPPQTEQQRLAEMPKPYEDGFRLGYHQRARGKALIKTILGGVVGTGIAVAIYASTEE